MSGFEENEVSINANGGTEISKRILAKLLPEELLKEFQIIPSRIRELEEDKIRVLWVHDLPEDPELKKLADPNFRSKFHKIVFNCSWQMNEFVNKLGIPMDDQLDVIELPVDPIELVPKETDKVNLIYFSTPHRGLHILADVYEELSKHHDNIHLDVFSSFKLYGWPDADKQFEPVYDKIRNNPKATYHGAVPQEELHEYLKKAHILAYPCVWKETQCRVLIESMSAGLLCVHPNLAALSDTSASLTAWYQFVEDQDLHAQTFYSYLDNAIKLVNEKNVQNYLKFAKIYADTRFNTTKSTANWTKLLESLKEKYPTVESRKSKGEMLVINI